MIRKLTGGSPTHVIHAKRSLGKWHRSLCGRIKRIDCKLFAIALCCVFSPRAQAREAKESEGNEESYSSSARNKRCPCKRTRNPCILRYVIPYIIIYHIFIIWSNNNLMHCSVQIRIPPFATPRIAQARASLCYFSKNHLC